MLRFRITEGDEWPSEATGSSEAGAMRDALDHMARIAHRRKHRGKAAAMLFPGANRKSLQSSMMKSCRVLAVINRLCQALFLPAGRAADQKAIGIDGCRLQAEHGAERKLASPDLPLRHGHKPVGGKHFVIAARAALLQCIQKHHAVEHESPFASGAHDHRFCRGVWLGRGACGVMMQNFVDERCRLVVSHAMLHSRHVRHICFRRRLWRRYG